MTIFTPSPRRAPSWLRFAATGPAKPDISILSARFLAEVRGMSQRMLGRGAD